MLNMLDRHWIKSFFDVFEAYRDATKKFMDAQKTYVDSLEELCAKKGSLTSDMLEAYRDAAKKFMDAQKTHVDLLEELWAHLSRKQIELSIQLPSFDDHLHRRE